MTTYLSQLWDVLLFAVLAVVHFCANYQDRYKTVKIADSNLQMLGTASTGGLIVVSILASAIMLLLTRNELESCSEHFLSCRIFRSLFWFVASLIFGLVFLFCIPMQSWGDDPRRRLFVICTYGFQLFAVFIGAIWFVVAITKL